MGKHSAPRGARGRAAGTRGRRSAASRRGRLDTPRAARSRRPSTGPLQPAPRMRVHRDRRVKTLKRVALIAAVVLAVAVVGGVTWAFFFIRAVEGDMNTSAMLNAKTQGLLSEPEPQEPFNVLLLGSDVRPNEEVARADTIIVARIDPEAKKVWLLSIPRDTRAEIPGHGTAKINSATFYGGKEDGPALMVQTVEEFLDIEIHHYVEVNFEGFQAAVDALGGVWIDVDTEIDDWKAASHSPGHKAKYIAKGYQLLDGEHALTYVRSRDFPDADFTRMRHQQEFFKALAKQAAKADNLLKLPVVVREVARYTITDMSVAKMLDLAKALGGIPAESIQTATLTGEWRSPYVWPDEERMDFLVTAMMDGRSFDETATATDEGIQPADISVTVRNGAGRSGIAGEASGLLRSKGFVIGEVGNANQFVYDRTLVIYNGDDVKAAQTVAAALPKADLVPSRGMYLFDTRILVVVGEDWELPVGPTATQ